MGVEVFVVEVLAPHSSGTSDGDMFPIYGTNSMGHVPPLPESLLYLLVLMVGGTSNKPITVVSDYGVTHLQDEAIYG